MAKKIALLLLSLVIATRVAAANPNPMLVIDALNQPGIPSNFRTTADIMPPNVIVNTQGLATLLAMGSAQFSEEELVTVITKIHAPILVVDLRQESHGFIAGNAVSWYGLRDWANLGKTPVEVEADQRYRLNELLLKPEITLNKITDKNNEGEITRFKSTNFIVKHVLNEYVLTQAHKLDYVRIYITDRIAPSDDQVDRFIQLVRSMPKDTWIYFHCRAGKGRTTTFMAMYDMMRNAKQVSFEDILQRQYLLGGIDLAKLPESSSYKYSLHTYRLDFLKNFYGYCRSNQNNFATTWSEWKKSNVMLKK